MSDIEFASGIYFDRHEKAPEFVIGRISVNRAKFVEWLESQETSEKGYVNMQVKRSKAGKVYVELDTWKPNQSTKDDGAAYRAAREGRYVPAGGEDPNDSIPF